MEVRPGWSWGRFIYSIYFLAFAFILPDNIGVVKFTTVFFVGSVILIDVFLRNRISVSRKGVKKGVRLYNTDSIAGFSIKEFSIDSNFPATKPALVMTLHLGAEVELLADPIFLEEAELEVVKQRIEKHLYDEEQ